MRPGGLVLGLAVALGCTPPEPVRVGIDGAHDNRHALATTFAGFGHVARHAGDEVPFVPVQLKRTLDAEVLGRIDVLVVEGCVEPMTADERAAVLHWVEGGGALWLLFDHPPYVEPVADLVRDLGAEPADGWARSWDREAVMVLRRGAELVDHPVLNGPRGRVDELWARGGAGFAPGPELDPIGWMPEGMYAWTDGRPTGGLAVIAARELGAGRVLIGAETSMVTCYTNKHDALVGYCSVDDPVEAKRFVKNALRWLSRR